MPGEYYDYDQGRTPETAGWNAEQDAWTGPGASRYLAPNTYVPGGYGDPGQVPPGGGFEQPDQTVAGWYGQGGWHTGTLPHQDSMGNPGAPRPARRSRRWLWGTVSVLAILLLAGGIFGVLTINYLSPIGTAVRFCGDLRAQTYSGAYELLSMPAQAAISEDDFVNDAVTLDRAEGLVLDCKPSGDSGIVNPGFGETQQAVAITIRRASAGSLTGVAHLTNEDGFWRISALDMSFWGVSLGAVQAMNTYCTALQSQAYSAAFAVLGAKQTAGIKVADYTQQGEWRDQVDGPVGTCQIMSVGTANLATAASFQVSITRHQIGEKQDTIGLDVEGGAWKITAIGPQLHGTDLGGLVVTNRFCDDLSHGRYADAYGLFSAAAIGGASERYFASYVAGQINGIKWASCTFDARTYRVSGSSASLSVDITFDQLSTGHTYLLSVTMKLAHLGHSWKLNDVKTQQ